MVTEKREKLTIKKPVVKKAESAKTTIKKAAPKKANPKPNSNIEVKEISNDQVQIKKVKINKNKLDDLNRSYATGKRKDAVARVWLKKGSGKITINNEEAGKYLKRPILEVIINMPFVVTETQDKFDVVYTVTGGGLSGQAGAIRHGIAKALSLYNTEAYRKSLKLAGLLTRDSRKVERKKAGLKKARKGQVFSKR